MDNTILGKYRTIESYLCNIFEELGFVLDTQKEENDTSFWTKIFFKKKNFNRCALETNFIVVHIPNIYDVKKIVDIDFCITVSLGKFPTSLTLDIDTTYIDVENTLKYIQKTITDYYDNFLKNENKGD